MKLACADFTFPLLAHKDSLQLISMLGCEGVDLGIFEGRSHITPSRVIAESDKVMDTLRRDLDVAGLKVADVFVQPGESLDEKAVNHPDESERAAGLEIFKRMLEFAHEIGADHISGLPGMPFPEQSEEAGMELAISGNAERVQMALDAGLVYSVEPHTGSIIPTPDAALAFVKQCTGLTLTLDYGHFIAAGMTNEQVHPLIAHAGHFHARGGAKGQLQATMAENTIDFPAIIQEMKRVNYPGWIGLEYVWIDWEGCNRADNVSESCVLRDLLKKHI